jgi:lysophospholipase L1-like esterase
MAIPSVLTSADIAAAGGDLTARPLSFQRTAMVACLGDSITANNWNENATGALGPTGLMRNYGYAYWAQMLSDGRAWFPESENFGIRGETSQQILARVSSAVSSPAQIVVVFAGTNDRGGANRTAAETISNIGRIVTALLDVGKFVIVCVPPPRGLAGVDVLTATQQKYAAQVYDYLRRTYAFNDRRVRLVDPWLALVNQANANAEVLPNTFLDGTHPGPVAAMAYGSGIAAILNHIVPSVPVLPTHNNEEFDALYNPFGTLNTNPTMQGVGGTKSGTTPTPTGDVADSYSISGTNAALTIVCAKVTNADNRTLQQITVGGTVTASGQAVEFYQNINVARFSPGDVIEAFAYVEVDGGTSGVYTARTEVRQIATATGTTRQSCGNKTDSAVMSSLPVTAYKGVQRVGRMTIQSDMTAVRLRFVIDIQPNVTVAAVARIGAIALRKV